MVKTPRQALEFVRRRGVVVMTRHPGRPSFVEAVVGAPVRGSWWGHERGKLIFTLAGTLHDSDQVLSLKLVDGKVTFVHRALWPALARYVNDLDRRKTLSPQAGALLRLVERRGTVRLDRHPSKGSKELEANALVHAGSMHTEKGAHTTVLTSWTRMFDGGTLTLARQMTMGEAKALLGI